MKILELTLINFSRVFSGLGKTKITLDFVNVNEEINLFVGDNGTGKTSIMGCLHPFAYNNAVGDSTSNSDLIIEKKDGKKIIKILSDDNNIYEIEHIYSRKKDDSISVKSFIRENGIELNDSGTVTTFKTVVLEKLGIDQTYLTLLSIGNTVEGFVKFTSSDRKNYATKIFTELEVFNRYYKNLSVADRNMKALLNNVVSKLSKYTNVDRNELDTNIGELTRKLGRLNNEKIELSQYIGGITNQLANYQAIISQHDSFESELSQLLSELSKLKYGLQHFQNLDMAKDETSKLNSILQELLVQKAEMKNSVAHKLDMKQSKMQTLASVENSLSKIETNRSVDELKELESVLVSEMNEIKMRCDVKISIDLSKDELIKAVIYLDELKSICDNFILDVVNQDNIVTIYEAYRKNRSIIKDYDYKYNNAVTELQQYSALTNTSVNVSIPAIRSNCKESSCAYKTFYDTYCSIMRDSSNKTQEKIRELERQVSRYGDVLTTLNIINKCMTHIDKYNSVLSKAGFIFNKDEFILSYMESREVYDVDFAQSCIETLEDIEKYNSLESKLNDIREKLKYYESTIELINSLNREKETLNKEIEEFDNDYRTSKVEYDKLYDDIEAKQALLAVYDKDIAVLEKIAEINVSIMEKKKELSEMDSIMNQINELKFKRDDYQSRINIINEDISNTMREKDRLHVIITNIDSLQAEEIEIREKYDLIKNIRFAVSPTTGIPLDFIEYYVKEEMIGKINELLDSVYHGRLRLIKDMVVVDDKEFTIPYMKNGTIVRDISKASDGERAILSIAFSLVLIQLSCNKYNIMLLDEIDTSLDAGSRGKFIDLLEEYKKMIGAKQLFLISHNNMFDTYPVNVILLSDYQSFNYSNANIMRIF